MLGDITAADEIYIVTGRTDMRKSIDGLCAIVEEQLHMDLRRSTLYLFCGKRCGRIKALLWESDGFVLLYKHMEVVCSASCYQLTSESLVKVIASEPCSKPPMLLGDRLC